MGPWPHLLCSHVFVGIGSQELGVSNGADAVLCTQAKEDLVKYRRQAKEALDAETARIARFEEERIKRERKVTLFCCEWNGCTWMCNVALWLGDRVVGEEGGWWGERQEKMN
jgi:hypothetical protein